MPLKSAKFNVFNQTKQKENLQLMMGRGDTVKSSSAREDADLPYLPVRVTLMPGTA